MRNWQDAGTQKQLIEQFERFKERAKANNFNAQLVSTMMIATVLAAFCAIILAQERKIEIVGWFPDRDNITTSYERIADHMFSVNFSAFCQRHNIDQIQIRTGIGLPELDPANPKQLWTTNWFASRISLPGRLRVGITRKTLCRLGRNTWTCRKARWWTTIIWSCFYCLSGADGIGVGQLRVSKTPFSDCPQET
jgi:hypothetical protein